MITVGFNPKTKDVDIDCDREGAILLVEILQNLLDTGEDDHIHLRHGPAEFNGRIRPPETHALSLDGSNLPSESIVSEMLTIAFQGGMKP